MQRFMFLLAMVLLPDIEGLDVDSPKIPKTLVCDSEDFQQKGLFIVTLKGQLFTQCEELKSLNLTKNNIYYIENHAFRNMGNLNQIDLSSNMISKLPTGIFSDTENLKQLYISKNVITSLKRNTFINLPNLKSVDFQYNNITYIEEKCFVNVPSLKTINLAYNNLVTLQFNIIDDLSSLSVFDLRGNTWNCDLNLCEFMHTVVTRFWPESFEPYCSSPKEILGRTFKEVIEIPLVIANSNLDINITANPVVLKCRTCRKTSLSWQFENSTILTDKAIETSEKYSTLSTITINDFSPANIGNYTCYIDCPTCNGSTWIYAYAIVASIPEGYELNTGRAVGLSISGCILLFLLVAWRVYLKQVKKDSQATPIIRLENSEEP